MTFLFRFIAIASFSFFSVTVSAAELDQNLRPEIADGRDIGQFAGATPNGELLADFARVRYLPDGARDPNYFPPPAAEQALAARIVGTAADGGYFLFMQAAGVNALLHFDADGQSSTYATIPREPTVILPQTDGKVILAGYTGEWNGVFQSEAIIRMNANGTTDPSFSDGQGGFPTVDPLGQLATAALQPDGKILIGGRFARVNGVTRRSLARLNSDGKVDLTFSPALSENAEVILIHALSDGRILVVEGPEFAVHRREAQLIAWLEPDGRLDHAMDLAGDGSLPRISEIEVTADGRLLVAGEFERFAGTLRRNLVRLNADGSIDTTFNADSWTGSAVDAVAVQPSGKILVYESSPSVTWTLPSPRVVRLHAAGSLDPTFEAGTPRAPGRLELIRDENGKMIIAGQFSTVNGVARPGLARLNVDGSLDTTLCSACQRHSRGRARRVATRRCRAGRG